MDFTQKNLSGFALLLLVAGQLLPQIDFSIVNVALDSMGQTLHTDGLGLVLIVALYGLSFASLIATGARLGERYGRKRLFLIGVAGFGFASTLCALAQGITIMLTGRLLQGVFGALLMPQILAIIHATLSGERHSRAVSIYTAAGGLSLVVGQVFGGWLVAANLFGLGWRLAFVINIPVCILVLLFGWRHIPESLAREKPTMDTSAMSLLTLGLLALLLPIALGQHWPQLWWLLLTLPPLGYALYKIELRKEKADQQPLLPPALFATPLVKTGFAAEMIVTMTFAGYLFVVALCVQSALHYSAADSGNALVGLGCTFFITSLLSKTIGQRIGNFAAHALGALFTLSGLLVTIGLFISCRQALAVWQLLLATSLVGIGNALMLTSAFRIALTHVAKHHASEASSALVTIQQGCFAIGTAIGGAVYAATLYSGYQQALSLSLGLFAVLLLLVAGTIFLTRPTQRRVVQPAPSIRRQA